MTTYVFSTIHHIVDAPLDEYDLMKLCLTFERMFWKSGLTTDLVETYPDENLNTYLNIAGKPIDHRLVAMVVDSMLLSAKHREWIGRKKARVGFLLDGRCIYLEIK